MNLSHITSDALRRVLSLTERKDELISLVAEIEAEIAKTLSGAVLPAVEVTPVVKVTPAVKAAAAAKTPRKPFVRAKRRAGKRTGKLKSEILAVLEAAGSEGLRVKDIAAKLGKPSASISVWFSTTGKDITHKVSPGVYAALGAKAPTGAVAPSQSAATTKSAKKPAKSARAKRVSKISAAGRARISAASKARWKKHRAAKLAGMKF